MVDPDQFYQSPELLLQNEEDEKVALSEPFSANRYKTCQACPSFYNRIKMCRVCYCFMPAKVRLESSKCPEGKW